MPNKLAICGLKATLSRILSVVFLYNRKFILWLCVLHGDHMTKVLGYEWAIFFSNNIILINNCRSGCSFYKIAKLAPVGY